MKWGIDNLDEYCGAIYSILLEHKDDQFKNYTIKTVDYVMDSRFSRFLKRKDSCARDYLGLYMLVEDQDKVFSYIQKSNEIPFEDDYLELIWTFANRLISSGKVDEGTKLLKTIQEKTDVKNKYHRYSKAKLETFNSRYENLWD